MFHLVDNHALDGNDKIAKVDFLYDSLNLFGFFTSIVSKVF